MLKQQFIELVNKYSTESTLVETLWNEIEKKHTSKKRHYHNLSHLDNLYHQLFNVKSEIEDWDTILFSMYYHDIVYTATSNDNERRSAELAKERLESIAFPKEKISKCVAQIMATNGHSISKDNDTNFFTDADLSILGQSWEVYLEYTKQIRKEYSIYPDFMYNPGRKKVVSSFLTMDRIFKTSWFFDKLEKAARENLSKELQQFY
jgi:predicted metal-dependent HD superfamily phosphohydrolase